MDEEIDVEATKRVANRAVISALIAFFSVAPTLFLPQLVAMFFSLVGLAVGISSARTLAHRDAAVIGALRWAGMFMAVSAACASALLLLSRSLVLLGVWK